MKKDNRLKEKSISLLSFSLFLIFLFSFTFISAQATTHTEDFPLGYRIVEKSRDTLTQNLDFQYDFYVYNSSTGNKLDNSSINCLFTLSKNNGTIQYEQNASYTKNTWSVFLDKSNFTRLGNYPYGVECSNSEFGGVLTGIFEITPSGKSGTDNLIFSIFVIVFLVSINLITFFNRNIPLTILTGMAVMFLGIYLINSGIIIYRDELTNYISYLITGLGAITSFWAIFEQLDIL